MFYSQIPTDWMTTVLLQLKLTENMVGKERCFCACHWNLLTHYNKLNSWASEKQCQTSHTHPDAMSFATDGISQAKKLFVYSYNITTNDYHVLNNVLLPALFTVAYNNYGDLPELRLFLPGRSQR